MKTEALTTTWMRSFGHDLALVWIAVSTYLLHWIWQDNAPFLGYVFLIGQCVWGLSLLMKDGTRRYMHQSVPIKASGMATLAHVLRGWAFLMCGFLPLAKLLFLIGLGDAYLEKLGLTVWGFTMYALLFAGTVYLVALMKGANASRNREEVHAPS